MCKGAWFFIGEGRIERGINDIAPFYNTVCGSGSRTTPSDSSPPQTVCSACKDKPALYACGCCHLESYCSESCQRAAWRTHAERCSRRRFSLVSSVSIIHCAGIGNIGLSFFNLHREPTEAEIQALALANNVNCVVEKTCVMMASADANAVAIIEFPFSEIVFVTHVITYVVDPPVLPDSKRRITPEVRFLGNGGVRLATTKKIVWPREAIAPMLVLFPDVDWKTCFLGFSEKPPMCVAIRAR
jgi:hypothetical protein